MWSKFLPFFLVVLAGFCLSCPLSPVQTGAAVLKFSYDLTYIIPLPVVGDPASDKAPEDIAYTPGEVVWTDISTESAVNPGENFTIGHTYKAEVTFTARSGYNFSRLTGSEWTAASGIPSQTNFYHRNAARVVQTNNTTEEIDIAVYFPVLLEPTDKPGGLVVMTGINPYATEISFSLDKAYYGTWRVYASETGGQPLSAVRAYFDVAGELDTPSITLKSDEDPFSPGIYYVSLQVEGRGESERLALWEDPVPLDDPDDPTPMSLASRFHIPDTALPAGAGGVSAVFSVLHAYIAKFSGSMLAWGYRVPGIALGDWIDLPSLEVAEYIRSDDRVIANAINDGQGGPVLNKDLGGDKGYLLRLIVVGNNSFHSRGSYWLTDKGARTHNDATPHLVFQFQNIPGFAKMSTGSSGGGYKDTGMRSYLVPSNGADWGDPDPAKEKNPGAFHAGLVNAGVPDAVLFAPKRYVTNNGKRDGSDLADGADEIEDKVWLPTVREMFGTEDASNGAYETAANQARLEYYTDNESRKKYNKDGNPAYYWEASPGWSRYFTPTSFCEVNAGGRASYISPDQGDMGVAPAFCVK
jgi:hypothetical protein